MTSSAPFPGAPTPPDGWRAACVHCGEPVVTVQYALGPKLVHEHPSRRFGSEYWHCKTTVATLAQEPSR